MEFTAEQRVIFEFIRHGTGHGIIDAVAGAGKTTTIMECARLAEEKQSILFCAFNHSIASEIAHKFRTLGLNNVTVKTIHSLGRQILLDNNAGADNLNLVDNKYLTILQDKGFLRNVHPYIKTIFSINGFLSSDIYSKHNFAANNLLSRFNARLLDINRKFRSTLTGNSLQDLEELVIHFGIFSNTEIKKRDFTEEIEAYFLCHQKLLEAGNQLAVQQRMIDYTDMIYLPHEWKLYPDKKYDLLFIDECQDLSKSQFSVVSRFGKKHGRILAVGDPHQSIYGFTGADIHSFQRVKDYTGAKAFKLTSCFRCPLEVITLAREIRVDIKGSKTEPGTVKVIQFNEVTNLARPGDLIISRFRAPVVLLIFDFIDKNIKVKIHEDEMHEIINEIRTIFKQEELHQPVSAIPGGFEKLKASVKARWRSIIDSNAARITHTVEREIYVRTEIKFLHKKLEFLHKKYEQWGNKYASVNDLLLRIKEFVSATGNPIRLSTIHRAKGLENERVFILNYDELPHHRQHQKEWEKIQEVNLKYVAITRALNELFLIESKKTADVDQEETLFDNLPFDEPESRRDKNNFFKRVR